MIARRLVAVVVAALLTAAWLLPDEAAAISATYFDSADAVGTVGTVGERDPVWIEAVAVSDRYVGRGETNLRAYLTASSGSITFNGHNYCPAYGARHYDQQVGSTPTVATSISRFWISGFNNGSGGNSFDGVYQSSSDCRWGGKTVNVSGLPFDAHTGLYVANIVVHPIWGGTGSRDAGALNTFQVAGGTNTAFITHTAGLSTGQEVSIQHISTTPVNSDYKIRFGADCSVTGDVTSEIRLFDLDSIDDGSGAQKNGPVSIQLLENGIPVTIQGIRPDGSPDGGASTRIGAPTGSTSQTYKVRFTAKPGRKYELYLGNVYYDNTIQYGLPFDGIYWNTNCKLWTMKPWTEVDKTTANPGETVTWTHHANNLGPGNTTTQVGFVRDGAPNSEIKTLDPGYQPAWDEKIWYSQVINGSDGGRTICYKTKVWPRSSAEAQSDWSSPTYSISDEGACVYIPWDYELSPWVSLPTRAVEPGEVIWVDSGIRNDGSTRSEPVRVKLSRLVLRGQPVPGAATSAVEPCSHFSPRALSCDEVPGGDLPAQEFPAATSTHLSGLESMAPASSQVGDKICFVRSVQPWRNNAAGVQTTWSHSEPKCQTVGKNPKVTVSGGDLQVGGAISTSRTRLVTSGKTYGSWVEYGVLSVDVNDGLASGSGLVGGNASAAQKDWSGLTFANVSPAGSAAFGKFSSSLRPHRMVMANHFKNRCSGAQLPQNANLDALASGAYAATGDVTIAGGTLEAGKQIILCVTGNVTVTGNISYVLQEFSSLQDIPQLVIVAKNIRIDGAVTHVESWIVADGDGDDGYLTTCDDVNLRNPALDSGLCKPLGDHWPSGCQQALPPPHSRFDGCCTRRTGRDLQPSCGRLPASPRREGNCEYDLHSGGAASLLRFSCCCCCLACARPLEVAAQVLSVGLRRAP